MPPYDLALFDFDGTLADSFPWFCSVFNDVAARHGFRQVAPDDVDALRGLDTRAIIDWLRVPAWRVPLVALELRRMAADHAASIPLHAGVAGALLRIAAAGVQLAIVSANSEDAVRRVLGPELVPLIAHFGCGASLFGKPARFRTALGALGVDAARAIALGDERRDIDAARAVGVVSGAVTWGFATEGSLRAARPDCVFTTSAELTAALTGS